MLTHAVISEDKLSLDRIRTKFNTQKEFTLYLCDFLSKTFPIVTKLPTKSNINSEVLSDLLNKYNLGNIDNKESKKLDKLLRFRNAVAHGDNSIPVKEDNIDEFTQLIQDLMFEVFSKIDNAVTNQTYLAID